MNSKCPIILFTPYFTAKTPERQAELEECLRRNLANEQISKLVLLIDDDSKPSVVDTKIQIIQINRRPTYQQWVDLSKELGEDCISLLANTDIYFDSTLDNICSVLRIPNTIMTLSRWEQEGEKRTPHPNPHWSQDTWAFHTSSNLPDTLYKALDVPLGVPRCDNKIAYVFAIHGWKIVNPLHFIHSVHLHETQQRNYDKINDRTIMGGVAYVHPGNDIDDASTIEIDIWAKGTSSIKKVSLNKSLDAWDKKVVISPSTFSPSEEVKLQPSNKQLNNQIKEFLTAGILVYNHLSRFRIYQHGNQLLFMDGLYPSKPSFFPREKFKLPFTQLDRESLAVWIKPVMETSPIIIKERPTSSEDLNFWQYPCATEKQAYENHLTIKSGMNIDREQRVIHTYLPLPWATYIDKKHYPSEIAALIKPRLMGMKSLAESNGYRLAVHTMCQQIHWRRFVEHFHNLGITDLHLSHSEKNIMSENGGYPYHIHSWPLIAVNIEDPTRSAGLIYGKPISEKRYLATFIGAHMPHYRSDVRIKLLEAAREHGGNDILVDLGQEWHFNKIVYQEQVANKVITVTEQEKNQIATQRYNEVLSDSIFSLCPEGAGPNTLRLWESLAVGAIPVVIADNWEPSMFSETTISLKDCCIFITSSEIDKTFSILRGIKHSQVKEMQAKCIELYKIVRSHRAF